METLDGLQYQPDLEQIYTFLHFRSVFQTICKILEDCNLSADQTLGKTLLFIIVFQSFGFTAPFGYKNVWALLNPDHLSKHIKKKSFISYQQIQS